jgi:hypothetical protein
MIRKKCFTVTAEKETKQREASNIRNTPHSVKFSVSSNARMYLKWQKEFTELELSLSHFL